MYDGWTDNRAQHGAFGSCALKPVHYREFIVSIE